MPKAKPKNTSAPVTITVNDAISRYGMSRTRLYNLLGERKITATKVGRQRLIHVASIDAYLAGIPEAPVGQARKG